ncbi:Rpn family recombination-promoting nuclease/putative transposase [Virgibacillus sp. CBA3643]|uniref:Rpn family recombination-promoting nuclease/putative transposase n=1 Tax=Virgibacillus sp. CBA3643 TaxID=2942278 RepID=UPI0035A3CAC5
MEKATATLILEEMPPYIDKDGLWKKVITELFEPFVLFFAPDLYPKLDWYKEPDSLEQEFHRVFPVKKGTKYTDKLMKVHLKNGEERWMLIHIEVQGYEDNDFAMRMFQYFYRIFDKYHKKIYAIALFADEHPYYKPDTYAYQFHGTELNYKYNTYKILDQDEQKLLLSDNPFAYAVLAGLYMLKSRDNASERYQFKRRLFELLLKGKKIKDREYVDSLLYFIDYLLEVPSGMKEELQEEVKPMMEEEASHMAGTGFPNSPTFKPIFDEFKEEAKKENSKEIALEMLREEFKAKDIVKVTGLTEQELEDIKTKL